MFACSLSSSQLVATMNTKCVTNLGGLVLKEILRPGVYYVGKKTIVITPEDIRHFCNTGNEMIRSGRMIPVPLEHQDSAVPMPKEKFLALSVRNHAGWVDHFFMDGNSLWAALQIDDQDVLRKLHSIRYVSPEIRAFWPRGDKPGYWKNCISHVALTPIPVWPQQKPFGHLPNHFPNDETFQLACQSKKHPNQTVRLSLALHDDRQFQGTQSALDYIDANICLHSIKKCCPKIAHKHDVSRVIDELKTSSYVLSDDMKGVVPNIKEEKLWSKQEGVLVHRMSGAFLTKRMSGKPSPSELRNARKIIKKSMSVFWDQKTSPESKMIALNYLPRNVLRHIATMVTQKLLPPCAPRYLLLDIILSTKDYG